MDGHERPQPDSRPVSPVSEDEFEEDYAPSIVAPSIRPDDDNDAQNPFSDPTTPTSPHIIAPADILGSQSSSTHQQASNFQSADLYQPQTSRYSVRKSPGPNNGVPDPDDDNQLLSPHPLRANSTSSSLVAPHSPIDTHSGPSHPYALYPQGFGISRTASVATTADLHAPSLRASPHPQRPAFPYAMYPQDISDSTSSENSPPSFTVGFPGHAQPFHRRIGADGEEQDIIGPDGHTEQLPPYTRYPDAAITKAPNDFGSSLPVIGEASQSLDNLSATRRPPSDSMSTSSGTESHLAPVFGPSSSTEPLNPSSARNDDHHQQLSEKSFKQKSWKQRRHHKLCGCLPVWGLLLGIAVVVIIVVVCGGVIGGYVVQLKDQYQKDLRKSGSSTQNLPDTSTLIDAYPITTPTTAPLPTGTFVVSLSAPDTRFPACLPAKQANAWSCNLPPEQSVFFRIYGAPDSLFLDTVPGPNATNTSYGSQPPELRGQKLKLVIDLDDKALGAAYHFQTFYDKLVIIPDFLLRTPSSSAALQEDFLATLLRRSSFLDNPSFQYPPVLVGDFAWFCRWDDSFLEGFVYVSTIRHSSQPSTTTTSMTTSQTSSTVSTTSSNPRSYNTLVPGYVPPTTSYTTPTTPYPTSSWYPELAVENSNYQLLKPRSDAGITQKPTNGTKTVTSTVDLPTTTPPPTTLKNIVKLEERRLQGFGGAPMCTRMTYQDDFRWSPAYDAETEQLVTIALKEDDGGNWMKKYRYKMERRADDDDADDGIQGLYRSRKGYHGNLQDTCYCQWISYEPPRAKKDG